MSERILRHNIYLINAGVCNYCKVLTFYFYIRMNDLYYKRYNNSYMYRHYIYRFATKQCHFIF